MLHVCVYTIVAEFLPRHTVHTVSFYISSDLLKRRHTPDTIDPRACHWPRKDGIFKRISMNHFGSERNQRKLSD